MDEKTWSLRWLVPGMMQPIVCLGLMAMGFQFEDFKSLVMFLYAFSNIMLGFKAVFHKDFDEIARNRYWPIAMFDAVIHFVLQFLGFCYVVARVSKQYTGKSLSEALIFASLNPQYDNRLFMELP